MRDGGQQCNWMLPAFSLERLGLQERLAVLDCSFLIANFLRNRTREQVVFQATPQDFH
jgi:hypothetical protein